MGTEKKRSLKEITDERIALQEKLEKAEKEERELLSDNLNRRGNEMLKEMLQVGFGGYYKEFEIDGKVWWVKIARKRHAAEAPKVKK